MDLTVLNLAVPSLSADLKPSSTQLLWIIDIYGFLVAGSLITMGSVGLVAGVRTYAQLRSMIRKLKSGEFRLYSRKKNPRTGKRRNLGTFKTLAAAKRHERAVQFFKRH